MEGLAMAAGSGLLYGSINVLAKPLAMEPLAKAAMAYFASTLVLLPFLLRLEVARADWPKVLLMGIAGAGVAPILLFYGLQQTAAADAGFLLTLELVTTAALAAAFLRERFVPREWLGLALLFCAAATVALASSPNASATDAGTSAAGGSTITGALLVLGAAVAWGVDNTVSTRLVGFYAPPGLIAIKGLIGATAATMVWLAADRTTPPLGATAAMAGLGVVSIAVSSLLFYNALRWVGAGRTSAMNIATTALIGAAGGWLVLHEVLRPLHGLALALVGAGAWLLARPSKSSSTTPV